MQESDILKAFEGRWRIKSDCLECMEMYTHVNIRGVTQSKLDHIKDMCLDFFRTGICLGEGEHCPTIPMSAIERASYEVVGFDLFWNAYDKKVGRPKCEKLWSKLTNKEMQACLDYIPLYKQAQPDKQYRKNPETFLRNKSWNDELIYKNNGDSTNDNRNKLAEILTP